MTSASAFPFPAGTPIPPTHWDGDLASDVFLPCGTPVRAPFDGVAQPLDFPLGGFTNRVVADDGTTFYVAHLQNGGRTSGRVTAGDTIGYVSDSGNAAGKGCHAHIAVGSINANGGGTIRPADWLGGAPAATDQASAATGALPSLGPVLIGAVVIALLYDWL